VSDRVSARTCHHATNHISPTGEKFKKRAGTLAQKHSGPDVGPERADEFGGRAQASLPPAQIHDPGDHDQLQGGEDREVGERDRLRADRGANCARRFDENVCDLALGFAVARNAYTFDPALVR
jgi:hypothetical protein